MKFPSDRTLKPEYRLIRCILLCLLLTLSPFMLHPSWSKEPKMLSFAEEIKARMPEGMVLPIELEKTFNWMEANGHRGVYTNQDKSDFSNHFLSFYPVKDMEAPGTMHALFSWRDLPISVYWRNTPDPDADKRGFVFASTGGEGSRAAIWLDDEGKQQFVHLGSGSGSTWGGIMTDDPVKFLQLFAIGYNELAFDEHHNETVMEVLYSSQDLKNAEEYEEARRESENPDIFYPYPIPPTAYRNFLKSEFDADTPKKASEILPQPTPNYDDDPLTDPFLIWMDSVTPPPTKEELERIEEMKKMAEELANSVEAGEENEGALKRWLKKLLP